MWQRQVRCYLQVKKSIIKKLKKLNYKSILLHFHTILHMMHLNKSTDKSSCDYGNLFEKLSGNR